MMEWALSLAALIVIVTVLRRVLRGHISLRVQYALWALVLVRALVPFSLFSSPLSVMNAADKVPAVSAVQAVRGYDELAYSPASGTVEGFRSYDYMRDAPETIAENSSGADFKHLETALTVREILLRVHAAGTAAVLAFFAVSRLRFSGRLRKSRRALDVPGSIIPVYVSDAVETPCLFGLFSPAVYLTPESAAEAPPRCAMCWRTRRRIIAMATISGARCAVCALRCIGMTRLCGWRPSFRGATASLPATRAR